MKKRVVDFGVYVVRSFLRKYKSSATRLTLPPLPTPCHQFDYTHALKHSPQTGLGMVHRSQIGHLDHNGLTRIQANLPNLRRLFVDARTEAEERSYSRNAVSFHGP